MPKPRVHEPPHFIAIEGPIRVGKTTLADRLADQLQGTRIRDDEANPYLEAFYHDRPSAAFQAQLHFLIQRFKQWHDLDMGAKSRRVLISDYMFEKDKIFAYLNLNDAELKIYDEYYELFAAQVPIPDLVIYLKAKPEALRKRIEKKNVPFEPGVSDDYLQAVVKAYEHFFDHYKSSALLEIDTSEIDFVDRNENLRELVRRVRQPIKGTEVFLPLGSANAD